MLGEQGNEGDRLHRFQISQSLASPGFWEQEPHPGRGRQRP
jgi:hypothetical protein